MTGVPADYDDAIYYDDFGNDITDDVDAECDSLYTALDSLVDLYLFLWLLSLPVF